MSDADETLRAKTLRELAAMVVRQRALEARVVAAARARLAKSR